jgi:hypothetical protein
MVQLLPTLLMLASASLAWLKVNFTASLTTTVTFLQLTPAMAVPLPMETSA